MKRGRGRVSAVYDRMLGVKGAHMYTCTCVGECVNSCTNAC